MKSRHRVFNIFIFSVTCGITLAALTIVSSAAADSYGLGSIHIDHPWARATPKGAKIGAGYMTITNRGAAPDRLISGSTPVATRLVIHKMTMDNDIMQMRPLVQGLEINPGATIDLTAESLHVMFEGLKQPLQQGQRIKANLVFEKAGTIEVEYVVEGMEDKSAMPPHPDGMQEH
ncbi:MAG: periplasmic copper chaperone [Alphaproteobacteria bacterium]|jgi:copper(I)-binding protein|nr:periplasmic copper chaperone [Alphaproteobacteria bacterium]